MGGDCDYSIQTIQGRSGNWKSLVLNEKTAFKMWFSQPGASL